MCNRDEEEDILRFMATCHMLMKSVLSVSEVKRIYEWQELVYVK